jgi:hypothetical protein
LPIPHRLTLPKKALALLLALVSFRPSLSAQSRQLTQFGGGLYWDQADPQAGPGHSLYAREFTFFDAKYPVGFYWGLLENADIHQRGTAISLDDHLLTLGWWGHPLGRFPIILNANVSPVLGIRTKGTSYLGDNYWGVGTALGIFFNLLTSVSFGLSWEPVWILSNGGEQDAPDKRYNEFGLSIVIKQLYW